MIAVITLILCVLLIPGLLVGGLLWWMGRKR